ncbi:CRE-SRN-1 protein [Aphelenchoides avenae]|nr:CRE-SRN-1 protein [Aphelenchus avenae]
MTAKDLPVEVVRYVFHVLSVTDVCFQLYNVFLILRVTPQSMSKYRLLMLLCTLYDLLFVLNIAYFMQPKPLMPFSCVSVHGLSKHLGTFGARISMAVAVLFDVMVVGGQLHCLLYRTCLIYGYRNASDVFTKPLAVLMYSLLAIVVGFALSRLIYNCLLSDESQSNYLVLPSAELFAPEDSVLFCLPITETLITAGAIIGGAFVIAQAVCITLSVLGMRHLKRNSNGFSAKTRAMHLQLTRLLLAQILSPMICLFVPIVGFVVFVIISMYTLLPWSNLPVELGILFFTAFPMVNAVLAITFVGPYRRFTASFLSTIFCRKSSLVSRMESSASGATSSNSPPVFTRRESSLAAA